MSMSLVSSFSSLPLHRNPHGLPTASPLQFGAPLVSFKLPYNKPAHKVAQQIVKGRCRDVAGSSSSTVQLHRPQPDAAAPSTTAPSTTNGSQSPSSAEDVTDVRDDRLERPRKRHLAMSLVFPAPQYCLKESYDLNKVRDTVQLLRLSGFYYENLSWQDADLLLKGSPVGTFLVRNSQDNRFLFALTVQTERGPTSVRVHYQHGVFRLDCEHQVAVRMPSFPCVVQLVEYYICLSESGKGKCCVWLDASGRRDLPIRIVRPRYNRVNSLQHLCRIAVNRSPQSLEVVPSAPTLKDAKQLPPSLKAYLKQYPHKH